MSPRNRKKPMFSLPSPCNVVPVDLSHPHSPYHSPESPGRPPLICDFSSSRNSLPFESVPYSFSSLSQEISDSERSLFWPAAQPRLMSSASIISARVNIPISHNGPPDFPSPPPFPPTCFHNYFPLLYTLSRFQTFAIEAGRRRAFFEQRRRRFIQNRVRKINRIKRKIRRKKVRSPTSLKKKRTPSISPPIRKSIALPLCLPLQMALRTRVRPAGNFRRAEKKTETHDEPPLVITSQPPIINPLNSAKFITLAGKLSTQRESESICNYYSVNVIHSPFLSFPRIVPPLFFCRERDV